ncbi:methylmalonyl-CoA mutase [Hanstruepera neustonica]|uniref:Methylmalonyl-CoA mutase n=1 Tax=Hanstruepera neustonica TaxID=1445657 RepID=A0A2K1DW36_9FLAO|nr:methylmalonyl-CoA mutase subunit beta [Hanstruepera neustonica]PNQ72227.1 methylmalonyl-CoA mutase [Hanstruepera neustonica]
MTKTLFDQFPEVSSKQWKQKIQADLKGADYNDTLIWKTSEGIDVKPFYHLDFAEEPLFRDSKTNSNWKICQTIYVQHIDVSNTKVLEALNRGAESIRFIIPSTEISLSELLKNIDLESTTIYIRLLFLNSEYVKSFEKILGKESVKLETDIIGHLCETGNWFQDLSTDHEQLASILKSAPSISINTALYQNAGATMVQQLAYGMAHLNEYFNFLDAKIDKNQKSTIQMVFQVAIGSNYFFEIAKLRALRVLYKTVAQEFDFNTDCLIFAQPTKRNKTIYDYNTNMLRTTTECMSAILGEADIIDNLPYDAIYHKNNEFGDRIARNQLLVLKHESYFDKVSNPADGAYYIEELTNTLAEKGLNLFKDIESNSGFLKMLKEGTIQRKIKEQASKEQESFNNGEITLLGTNKHPNPSDKMNGELELYPFIKTDIRKTLIEPLIGYRLAEKLEQERLKTE